MKAELPAVWLWQRIVTPHFAGLAAALARQGCEATFVAGQIMSVERAQQGWLPPDLGDARLVLAPNNAAIGALVNSAAAGSIHICEGIRANGRIATTQRALARRGLRQWVVLETVDNTGWRGALRRLAYRRLFVRWQGALQGLLAIGDRTPSWVVARGFPAGRVFPFSYFLPLQPATIIAQHERPMRFRFVFAGQLIARKRLDLLLAAIRRLQRTDIELAVIGAGPLEPALRELAQSLLPGQVLWLGGRSIAAVPGELAAADCLVLPSRFDGWGAVVSEALMVGTPAICSDACGAAAVVAASRVGGVFRSGDVVSLATHLAAALARGRVTAAARHQLAAWACALGDDAGARYLQQILAYTAGHQDRPVAPWESGLVGAPLP